ncbi:MAG TPA: endonuclease/exonuclease/phosphatase family protein [bacterium]|nr:endonuclease/exonuclease/phosphatase family protein [bacterium]
MATTILTSFTCKEGESFLALRNINEDHFKKRQYEYAALIDSRDFRQIDVAVLSRLETLGVRSHVDDLDPEAEDEKRPWIFSRDCLEIDVGLNKSGSRRLTLFVNHLKSKYAETASDREKADKLRERQAKAVLEIVRSRFPGAKFNSEFFAVVGDLNDEPTSPSLKPLVESSGLVDALARISVLEDRWTHWYRSENAVSQLDHVLLSPALVTATAGSQPRIERRGISFSRVLRDGKPAPKLTHFHRFDGDPNPIDVDFRAAERFEGVTSEEDASDHCPVFLGIP